MAGGLLGRLVLVTREGNAAVETRSALEERGARCLLFPTTVTEYQRFEHAVRDAVSKLREYDYVVLPSPRAAKLLVRELQRESHAGAGARRPEFLCTGRKTEAVLAQAGLRGFTPPREDAAGVLEMLTERVGEGGKIRVMVMRPEKGVTSRLVADMRSQGFEVQDVVCYATRCRQVDQAEIGRLLDGERPDVATFLSPSSFGCFVRILGRRDALEYLASPIVLAIGRTTAQAMQRFGLVPDFVPSVPSSWIDELDRFLEKSQTLQRS